MSEELDFIFSSGSRPAPNVGRRAREARPAENDEELTAPQQAMASSVASPADLPKPDRPGKRKRMWENDADDKEVMDSRLLASNVDRTDSDDEDMPVIPDLEQLQDEPFVDEIAAPPTTLLNEIFSYQELDTDLMKQSAFQMLDNEIDLKILTKVLIPERETQEEDETWDMDKLFAEVRSMVTSCNNNASDQLTFQASTDKREVLI